MYNLYLSLEPEDKAPVKKLVAPAPKPEESSLDDSSNEDEATAKPSVQFATSAKKTVKSKKSKESSSDIEVIFLGDLFRPMAQKDSTSQSLNVSSSEDEKKPTPGKIAAVAPSSFDTPTKTPTKVSFSIKLKESFKTTLTTF